jgi:hypothetical protein
MQRNQPSSVLALWAVISLVVLAALFLPRAARAEDPAQTLAARPFATSLLFAFHSDPEVALHHFLFRWAQMQAMEAGTIPRRYPEPTLREADQQVLEILSPEEKALWEAALAHYRDHVAGRSLLFDEGLLALRDALAGTGTKEAVPEAERETLRQVARVLPMYARHWWPRHDRENREWVAAVFPDVIRFERQIAARIAAAYGGVWPNFPERPNRVDLAPYASSTAAYTTSKPHTVLAVDDPTSSMPWALELLFHEASHSNALEGRLHGMLEAAYSGLDREPPRNLWHILLFSISGQATHDVLVAAGREYTPLAQQFDIFTRRESYRQIWAVVERLWYPAMAEGKPLEAVLPALVAAIGSGSE